MALTPFLMFTGQAEEAIRFYAAVFPDAEILHLDRYDSTDAGPPGAVKGSVKGATFRIANQTMRCIDSPIEHAFGFTPAVSFFYDCADEAELDALFEKLADGGTVLMPPDRYPFAGKFGWLNDRYGVSWQLSVAAE
jgi:predicted 3-demethylubiquinone-9 3-methyltransferase (glyoxalase superfamily)